MTERTDVQKNQTALRRLKVQMTAVLAGIDDTTGMFAYLLPLEQRVQLREVWRRIRQNSGLFTGGMVPSAIAHVTPLELSEMCTPSWKQMLSIVTELSRVVNGAVRDVGEDGLALGRNVASFRTLGENRRQGWKGVEATERPFNEMVWNTIRNTLLGDLAFVSEGEKVVACCTDILTIIGAFLEWEQTRAAQDVSAQPPV